MGNDIELQHFDHLVTTRSGAAIWYVQSIDLPGFFSSVVTALESAGSDSWLCQALADHLDFCELAARVAAVRSLRSELADRDLTAAERATLDRLADDPCNWIRNEARGALDDLANPLPDQVAAHDGAPDDSAHLAELDFICLHGLTDDRHARLNWLRANGSQEVRARAGNLLISLAGVAK